MQTIVSWVAENSATANNTLGNSAYSLITANSSDWQTSEWNNINNKPTEFLPSSHFHHASSINAGVLDPARIPVINTSIQIISQGSLADLTVSQQNSIVEGAIVTTTDGQRYIYVSGLKTSAASYIALSDITPDWNVIANKPSTFAPSSHTHSISDVTGLQSVVSFVSSNSGNWNATLGNSAYTLINSNSGNWLSAQWNNITNKPSTFAPSSHTHSISDVTGLQPTVTWVAENSANPAIINYVFDNNTSIVNINSKGSVIIPSNFRISEWKIITDTASTTTINLNKSNYDAYPSMTLLGSISLTGGRKNINSAPNFANLSANDILEFLVYTNSSATKITVSLKGYKI